MNPSLMQSIRQLERMERPKMIKIPNFDSEYLGPIQTRSAYRDYPEPIKNMRDYFVFGTTLDPKKWEEEKRADKLLMSKLNEIEKEWTEWRED